MSNTPTSPRAPISLLNGPVQINKSVLFTKLCQLSSHLPHFMWRDQNASENVRPPEVNVFISYNCLRSVLTNLSLLGA